MIMSTFVFTGALNGQQRVVAIINARIYPVTQTVMDSSILLIQGEKIMAVGEDIPIPPGADVIDAGGKHVMPGIIESHSHMGQKLLWLPAYGSDNNELSKPINAECRAIDGLNINDRAFSIALQAGVTTMNICTGSRSPNSGQPVVVKLRGGTAEEMFLADGGMKFAIRATTRNPGFPTTVGAVDTLLRQELKAAQDYRNAWKAYDESGRKGDPPARDLKHEALAKVLSKEWIVGVHATREQDMRIAMGLKKDFDLDLYIIHGYAVDAMAEELVELGIPISYGPVFPGAGREGSLLDGPVRFHRLGGKLSFQQDHPDGHQYYLRPCASLFVRKGMSQEDALRALTINPAELLRLEDRIGSLEPGKDADVLILSGPPLEFESLVERVFIDGKEVYNRIEGTCIYRAL
jgi:imidazolonepropionase-like amidohydrolase